MDAIYTIVISIRTLHGMQEIGTLFLVLTVILHMAFLTA